MAELQSNTTSVQKSMVAGKKRCLGNQRDRTASKRGRPARDSGSGSPQRRPSARSCSLASTASRLLHDNTLAQFSTTFACTRCTTAEPHNTTTTPPLAERDRKPLCELAPLARHQEEADRAAQQYPHNTRWEDSEPLLLRLPQNIPLNQPLRSASTVIEW